MLRASVLKSLAPAVAALAMLGSSAQAASADLRLRLRDNATLADEGRSVLVPVEYSCDGAPVLSVKLVQGDAKGSTSMSDLVCDGTPRSVKVKVGADGEPFSAGTANATAKLDDGDSFASVSQSITIR